MQFAYPASVFQCKDEPDSAWVQTENDLNVYLILLATAGEHCRTQLKRIPDVLGLKVDR